MPSSRIADPRRHPVRRCGGVARRRSRRRARRPDRRERDAAASASATTATDGSAVGRVAGRPGRDRDRVGQQAGRQDRHAERGQERREHARAELFGRTGHGSGIVAWARPSAPPAVRTGTLRASMWPRLSILAGLLTGVAAAALVLGGILALRPGARCCARRRRPIPPASLGACDLVSERRRPARRPTSPSATAEHRARRRVPSRRSPTGSATSEPRAPSDRPASASPLGCRRGSWGRARRQPSTSDEAGAAVAEPARARAGGTIELRQPRRRARGHWPTVTSARRRRRRTTAVATPPGRAVSSPGRDRRGARRPRRCRPRCCSSVDFDGTLAVGSRDPAVARIEPLAQRALRRLGGIATERARTASHVAVLTGRDRRRRRGARAGRRRRVPRRPRPASTAAWRAARAPSAWSSTTDPAFDVHRDSGRDARDGVAAELGSPPWLFVERKGPSVAFHVRQADDVAAARAAVVDAIDRVERRLGLVHGLAHYRGRSVVDLRPRDAGGKREAVERLIARHRPGARRRPRRRDERHRRLRGGDRGATRRVAPRRRRHGRGPRHEPAGAGRAARPRRPAARRRPRRRVAGSPRWRAGSTAEPAPARWPGSVEIGGRGCLDDLRAAASGRARRGSSAPVAAASPPHSSAPWVSGGASLAGSRMNM